MDIRGLNNPSKQKEVLSFIRFHKLCMFGVVESKVCQEFFDVTVRHCFPSSQYAVHNRGNDKVARIILGWDLLS